MVRDHCTLTESLCFSYGIHLAQALTKTVLERGYTPFVVIRPENDASRNLYTKLGFVKAFETVRVTLNPEGFHGLNGHHVSDNTDEQQAQADEGIEDLRNDSVSDLCAHQNDVDKDEGIDEEEKDD